jgi:type I restriction enzyme R subunit
VKPAAPRLTAAVESPISRDSIRPAWLIERLQKRLDDYNAGSLNVQMHFDALVAFGKELDHEETRALSEGLNEELAVFDLVTGPDPDLSSDEEKEVKRVAEDVLTILKRDKLVIDWRKEQQTRAAVRVAVEETLDRLPEKFTRQIYAQKCDAVYRQVFESYFDDGRSVYDVAA